MTVVHKTREDMMRTLAQYLERVLTEYTAEEQERVCEALTAYLKELKGGEEP